ncbi:MAG TPA: sigma-70 family RNA polymerase sigma factor [Steroidobacteraceae bacterium]|nr:sigma-70 family RNA polymerase sigma factor [Steroidobacteraceae bacterium]
MGGNFDEVIGEYGPALARVAASYERDRALREELLQEIFMAIVSALPRLQDPEKLKPFVFRIAHNRAVRHIQQRVREPRSAAPTEDIAAEAPSHEQALIASERSEKLLEAIRDLTLPHQQVITLLLEDLTYPEIADVLGISVANVGIRINRAKEQLKEALR